MNESGFSEAMWAGRRLLIVSPHPDDETSGCGGTVAKATRLGSDVYVIYVSVGTVGHYGRGLVRADTRVAEVDDVATILGVKDYELLYTDSSLDTLARRDLVTLLEKQARLAIDNVRPDMLLIPAKSYHQDHRAVHEACMSACRPHLPAHKAFVETVLSYDQPQLTWGIGSEFRPDVYVEISEDDLATKLRAHGRYASQMLPEPHPGSLANVERLARVRGSDVCVRAAEAFQCHRLVA
jgi:LmbE family N-acetylglucosaminyl deacetylase